MHNVPVNLKHAASICSWTRLSPAAISLLPVKGVHSDGRTWDEYSTFFFGTPLGKLLSKGPIRPTFLER